MEEHARDPLRGLKEALGAKASVVIENVTRPGALPIAEIMASRRVFEARQPHAFIDYPKGHAHRGSCVKCGLLEGQHRA